MIRVAVTATEQKQCLFGGTPICIRSSDEGNVYLHNVYIVLMLPNKYVAAHLPSIWHLIYVHVTNAQMLHSHSFWVYLF